jgi:hypothetical protein
VWTLHNGNPTGLQLPLLPHGQVGTKKFPSNARQLSHSVDSLQWQTTWHQQKDSTHQPPAQLERDLLTIYKYDPKVLASNEDLFDNPMDKLLTFPRNEIEK